ncbi:MAG: hypothetical protein V5A88_02330 [Candidatus Thermoplasmatota archaeon]
MKKTLSITLVLLLTASFPGCLNGPSPPGADLPELIVHHPEEKENETVMNIRAMELVLFDEVTLYLNDTVTGESEELHWNNSFGPEHTTHLPEFEVDVYVRDGEDRYNFNATFELYPDEGVPEDEYEEEVVYRITYYDGEKEYITKDDLPTIEPLNPMEDEDS